jgi:hypothetical protein
MQYGRPAGEKPGIAGSPLWYAIVALGAAPSRSTGADRQTVKGTLTDESGKMFGIPK